jgi:hypothetical protein
MASLEQQGSASAHTLWRALGPWPILVLGLVDRFILIACFGGRYVSTDDAISWSAAVDFSNLAFYWPYYYGQDYGPLLEAWVAAPLLHLGIPLRWLMPSVTSALALLPFWSFSLMNHRNGRPWAALVFAFIPLLLPLEYGMMTTQPRGFVTGLAALALLPWALGSRNAVPGAFLSGLSIGIAWYLNPNTVIFSVPYLVWYMLTKEWRWTVLLGMVLGTLPGLAAHAWSQAWCAQHSDAIVHRLSGTAWSFDPAMTWNGMVGSGAHLQWLCPVLWGYEAALGVLLIGIAALAFRTGERILGAALLVGLFGILASFSLPKVHDGWDSVFFPLSRMFLAVPLLLGWSIALLLSTRRPKATHVLLLAGLSVAAVTYKAMHVDRVGTAQVAAQTKWVAVATVDRLAADAALLQRSCADADIDLIVTPIALGTGIWAQFRSYLHPTLVEPLPPTYCYGYERRHWQRARYGSAVRKNILVIGGSEAQWARAKSAHPMIERISDLNGDLVHVVHANGHATDLLMEKLMTSLQTP